MDVELEHVFGQCVGSPFRHVSHCQHAQLISPTTGVGAFEVSGAVNDQGQATHTFSLNPGETFDRELTIEFPYNSYAGSKTIEAQFMVQADKTSNFSVPLTLRLGLSDVGMQTLALRDGKDVIVQQTIQNYGERPIDYGSFAIFPGQARQERLVTHLAPGRTTLKRYRFSDVKVTPGMKIRVGVKELEGSRILNDEVEIQ